MNERCVKKKVFHFRDLRQAPTVLILRSTHKLFVLTIKEVIGNMYLTHTNVD